MSFTQRSSGGGHAYVARRIEDDGYSWAELFSSAVLLGLAVLVIGGGGYYFLNLMFGEALGKLWRSARGLCFGEARAVRKEHSGRRGKKKGSRQG